MLLQTCVYWNQDAIEVKVVHSSYQVILCEFRQSLSIVNGLTVFLVLKLDSFRPGVSNYAADYMSFHDVISYSPKPFKFFDIWTDHPKLCR